MNLRTCEGKGVVAPKFGFPLVLEACHKIIGGVPFDDSGTDNPLLADFKKKAGGLKELDQAARLKLTDAKRALGAKFDIRQFHDVVLTNGALPLDVLEDLVNRWIKSKQT